MGGRFRAIWILLFALLMVLAVKAQEATPDAETPFLPDDLEVITAENLNQLEQVAMLRRGTIEEMAWSPNGELLAVGGSAGGWIYDANNLQATPIQFAQFMHIVDLDFSPDGRRIISTGNSGALYEWDVETGELTRTILPEAYSSDKYYHPSIVTVKYRPDGNYIAAGASNAALWLLDAQTGDTLQIIPQPIEALLFSPDGRYLAAVPAVSGSVLVWTIETLLTSSEPAPAYEAQMGMPITDIAWTPDSSQILAVAFPEQGIKSFTLQTEEINRIGDGSGVIAVSSESIATHNFEISSDGSYVGYEDIVHRDTGEIITRLEGHTYPLTDIRFSPSGHFLAISQEDGSIDMWDTVMWQHIGSIVGGSSAICRVTLLQDRYLLSSEIMVYAVLTLGGDGGGSRDNVLHLWDIQTGQELNAWQWQTLDIDPFGCGVLIATPDGQHVLLQRGDEIIVFNPFTEENFPLSLPAEDAEIIRILKTLFSPDGSLMGMHISPIGESNSDDPDVIIVWDISGGLVPHLEPSLVFSLERRDIEDFAFDSTGQNLITSTSDGRIFAWDVETGDYVDEIGFLRRDRFNPVQLALSPDGATLAIDAEQIHLLDTSNYEEIEALSDEKSGVGEGIFYGTRNDWFVTSSGFWSSNGRQMILPVTASDIAFRSDGSLIVTGSGDGTIRLWGVRSQQGDGE